MLYVWVALGSGGGGVLRYALDLWVRSRFGDTAPWGILVANLLGSFLIGVVMMAIRDPTLRLTLATGVLGGFTTFSTFSLHTVQFAQSGRWGMACMYPALSVAGGILGCLAGLALAEGLRRP